MKQQIQEVEDTEERNLIVSRAQPVFREAMSLKVCDEPSASRATDLIKLLRELRNEAEKERKSLTEPINKSLKAINTKYKTVTEPLSEMEETLRRKLLTYQDDKRIKILEAEAEDGVERLAPVEVPKVVTQTASAGSRKMWDFELEDKTKVPVSYLTLDVQVIREAIRVGVREIPGLRIYEKDILVVR